MHGLSLAPQESRSRQCFRLREAVRPARVQNYSLSPFTIFLFVCLLWAGAVRSQTTTVSNTAELKQTLQLKLEEWHKAGSFPGATMGVVLANGDRGGESFGLAVRFSDRELKTPMRPIDRMLAGSVGKTFAAATALHLVKE